TRFSRDWSSDVCSSDMSISFLLVRNFGSEITYPTNILRVFIQTERKLICYVFRFILPNLVVFQFNYRFLVFGMCVQKVVPSGPQVVVFHLVVNRNAKTFVSRF